MGSRRAAVAWCGALLLAAAWRAAAAGRVPAGGGRPPPVVVPDLARDGPARLAWLPELGPVRAERVARERPFLGAPLSASRLAWIPGLGDAAARGAEEALARWAALAARQAAEDPRE